MFNTLNIYFLSSLTPLVVRSADSLYVNDRHILKLRTLWGQYVWLNFYVVHKLNNIKNEGNNKSHSWVTMTFSGFTNPRVL